MEIKTGQNLAVFLRIPLTASFTGSVDYVVDLNHTTLPSSSRLHQVQQAFLFFLNNFVLFLFLCFCTVHLK